MRVTLCVDALQPQLTGIGRYTWELSKGLAARPEIPDLQFYTEGILVPDPAKLLQLGNWRPRTRWGRRWRKWRQAELLRNPGLVHGPNYFLPCFAKAGVITVHDLSVLRFPETHPPERVAFFERHFLTSLERASHVITDTETVRREVIAQFGLRPNSVTAVSLGVDSVFRPRPAAKLTQVLAGLGLQPCGYGLSVSTFEPRKRLGPLIEAWRTLPASLRNTIPLVLAGSSGWRNADLQTSIAQGVSEGWLINLGFVSPELLPALYSGAALFAYPSIYEGFGLPPLEAMASGVPVIVAPRSCLPEVCGDVPLYVDPDEDPALFRSEVERALTDDKWRERAVRDGPERAASFTWQRCVAETVKVYEKVTLTT
jgi:alpha-1,3-rhamnosyl/mannosyltransferase